MSTGDPAANTKKTWDPKRLFQRVNSPSFNFRSTALSGLGRPLGTRTAEDFASFTPVDLLRKAVIAMVPNWVRTEVAMVRNTLTEFGAEHETFGLVRRSFQTWTDTPPFQWHRFYDWNFHVEPEAGLDWVRGLGNHPPSAPPGMRPVVPGHTLEIEWDAGAFGTRPGPMFNEPKGASGALTRDWCWPMSGDHVWVVGRSIYDGGHPDDDGRSRSELHPCKAMASARRAAFKFPNTDAFVPVTQFMFFASRIGGYKDFPSLAPQDAKDYEFLVDLPLRPDDRFAAETHALGATPEFPLNRIVLREIEPLVFFDFVSHQNASGKKLSPSELQKFKPTVKIERPEGESDPDKFQARVSVPLMALSKQRPDIDTYGVIISLGWPDANGAQAKKVKRCRVNFTSLHPVQDQGSDVWRFKIGVNGRWFHWEEEDILPESDPKAKDVNIALPSPIEFFLPEDEAIRVNFHGAALRAVDDAYTGRGIHFDGTDKDRTVMINGAQLVLEQIGEHSLDVLFPNMSKNPTAGQIALAILGGLAALPIGLLDLIDTLAGLLGISSNDAILLFGARPADWDKDIDVQPPHATPGAHPSQNVVARNVAAMMDHTFGVENNPLPLIDAGFGSPSEQKLNPLAVKGRNDAAPVPITLRGLLPSEVGKSAELVEFIPTDQPARSTVVAELHYTVQVEDQTPPANPS